MSSIIPVSFTPLAQAHAALAHQGYLILTPHDVAACVGCPLDDLMTWISWWDDLPPDTWLKDGGRYRRRRHSCFVVKGERVEQVPHRAHWQPVEYNALHGGMQRLFEPMPAGWTQQPLWAQLLLRLGQLCAPGDPRPWFVEAHPFRIDTTDGIGRPTPEGAHRDGVDFVAVFLVGRQGVKGGETRVFDAHGPRGERFTLTQPWSLMLIDDARVIHESTPIQPVDEAGHRDTLVLTFRRGGFQGDDET